MRRAIVAACCFSAMVMAPSALGTPFTSTVTRTDCQPLPGLLAWWRAEGTNDEELRRFSVDKEAMGYAVGKVGVAFQFGAFDSLLGASVDEVYLDDFTFEAWIYPDKASGAPQTIFSGGGAPLPLPGTPETRPKNLQFGLTSDLKLFLGQEGKFLVSSTRLVLTREWTHVGVVRSGETITFFINGEPAGTGSYGPALKIGNRTSVGGDFSSDYGPVHFGFDPFQGLIDELALFERALSADELGVIVAADTTGKCAAYGPAILSQSGDLDVLEGHWIHLVVSAVGAADLVFQWFRDGEPVENATGAALSLSDVSLDQAGAYTLEVRNPFGVAVTSPMNVRIEERFPPVILRHPDPVTTRVGSTVTLSVEAEGHEPLTYAWYYGAARVAVGGEYVDTPVLTLENIQPRSSGYYHAVVSNRDGVAQTLGVRVLTFEVAFSVRTTGRGQLEFLADGAAGTRMALQESVNLVTWTPVANSTISENGEARIPWPVSAGKSRFYRVVHDPLPGTPRPRSLR